jgi:large subunit ribosomal protein L4
MNKIAVYTAQGIKKEAISLPKEFSQKGNEQLLAQAVRIYEHKSHPSLAKAKTRGEVSISTRKIYKQKGTGGARHGAKSAPIFVGGGVAHGPKGIKRKLKLSKEMVKTALYSAISLKIAQEKLLVVDGISSFKKTKDVAKLISKIAPGANNILFVLSDVSLEAKRFIRNLDGVKTKSYRSTNAYDVISANMIILDGKILMSKTKRINTKKK